MCNCKVDIEAKLATRFREQQPQANNHRAELIGYSIAIGKESLSMFLIGQMPIELVGDFPAKKASPLKRRKFKQIMFFNYCPFCGEKYEVKS